MIDEKTEFQKSYMHQIEGSELSDKARMFVEKRRGETSVMDYISRVFENLSDKLSSCSEIEGTDMMSLIEMPYIVSRPCASTEAPRPAGKNPRMPANDNATIGDILRQMQKTYPERIPFEAFYDQCCHAGIPLSEIEETIHKNRGSFRISTDKSNGFVNILVVLLYYYMRDTHCNKSATEYYGICLEKGLTVHDIRFAQAAKTIEIPEIPPEADQMAHPETALLENKLARLLAQAKRDYGVSIPVQDLLGRSARMGITIDEVDKLQRLLTQQLIAAHNSPGMGMKTDSRARVNAINERIGNILNNMSMQHVTVIPPDVFYQNCRACNFSDEEITYAMKVLKDHNDSVKAFYDIKYLNNKAYLILSYLRTVYPGKIPYNIFYNRCRSMGLTKEEIIEAFRQIGSQMFTERGDDEYYMKVLDDIIVEYKQTRAGNAMGNYS